MRRKSDTPLIGISKRAYAEHAGVHVQTIYRWLENQRISCEPDGSIDPVKADRQRADTESPLPHHQARKAQFEAQKSAAAAGAIPGSGKDDEIGADIGRKLKLETYRLQRAKAELANVELDTKAGLLVERSDVDFVIKDFSVQLSGRLNNIPAKLSPVIAGLGGDVAAIHDELSTAVRDILEDLSAHFRREADRRMVSVRAPTEDAGS